MGAVLSVSVIASAVFGQNTYSSMPPTDAPMYSMPPTEMPMYSMPSTVAPYTYTMAPTDAPIYSMPPTEAPVYSMPPTDAPMYSMAPTDAPQYSMQPTEAPQYSMPPTDAPQYSMPPTDMPQYSMPPTDMPQYSMPPTDSPQYSMPPTYRPESTSMPTTNAPTCTTDDQCTRECTDFNGAPAQMMNPSSMLQCDRVACGQDGFCFVRGNDSTNSEKFNEQLDNEREMIKCVEAVKANETCFSNPQVIQCLGGRMDICDQLKSVPPMECMTMEIREACMPEDSKPTKKTRDCSLAKNPKRCRRRQAKKARQANRTRPINVLARIVNECADDGSC